MKRFLLFTLVISILGMRALRAQEVMDLYPGEIPGAKAVPATYRETRVVKDGKVIRINKVFRPALSIYKPAPGKANGTAVIICPGGGYLYLAVDHEGDEVARKFVEKGVTAFVLNYRLPSDSTMADKSFGPLQDAEQAIYLVRKHAGLWNVNPDKVGIMGFSAGGHLAATLAVHYRDSKIENQEKISLRPDFSILIYPVISFLSSPHVGSVVNLIGANGTPAQKEYFSNELHVDTETPMTFMVHANDDDLVPVENSILFERALVKNKVPAELHLYESGGHGYGMHNKTTADQWFERLQNWMTANRLLNRN